MPSPFPGMDPYLEAPTVFPGLHNRLVSALSDALQAALPAPYFAEIGERVWVEVSRRYIEPDASVLRGRPVDGGGGVVAAAPARGRPVVVTVPHDERREPRVEIRTAVGGDERLVTAIEILSPSNKTPGERGRDLYLRKQREILDSPGPSRRDRPPQGRPAHHRRPARPAPRRGRGVRLPRLGPPLGPLRRLLRLPGPPRGTAARGRHPAPARRPRDPDRPPGPHGPGLRRRPLSPPDQLPRILARPAPRARASGVGRRPRPRGLTPTFRPPSPGRGGRRSTPGRSRRPRPGPRRPGGRTRPRRGGHRTWTPRPGSGPPATRGRPPGAAGALPRIRTEHPNRNSPIRRASEGGSEGRTRNHSSASSASRSR